MNLEEEVTDGWLMMKNTSSLRHERGVGVPVNKDSVYNGEKVEREERAFRALRVPKKLQAALPYRSKQTNTLAKAKAKKGKGGGTYAKARAVVREASERKRSTLLQAMATIGNEKREKAKAANAARLEKRTKEAQRRADKFKVIKDMEKKRKYREKGKEEQRKRIKAGLEEGPKRRR